MSDRAYTVEEVIVAECTLEPMVCKFCGSHEVTFNQYLHDALCGDCGKWQIEDDPEYEEA